MGISQQLSANRVFWLPCYSETNEHRSTQQMAALLCPRALAWLCRVRSTLTAYPIPPYPAQGTIFLICLFGTGATPCEPNLAFWWEFRGKIIGGRGPSLEELVIIKRHFSVSNWSNCCPHDAKRTLSPHVSWERLSCAGFGLFVCLIRVI